jgi:hypothetical protein
MVVVEDASWSVLAERFGTGAKTVKRWAADAINALVERGQRSSRIRIVAFRTCSSVIPV